MMSLDVDGRVDAVVLRVEGELDALTTPRLRAAITAAFAELDGRPLVIDLGRVTFLGSPALSLLLDSAHEAAQHPGHRTLRIVVDHARAVVRPIELMGFDAILTLFHDLPAALDG